MQIHKWLFEFAFAFIVTLVIVATVAFLWNLIGPGVGTLNRETSFRFAMQFGIILARAKSRVIKKRRKS